jgi:hypothetical protein
MRRKNNENDSRLMKRIAFNPTIVGLIAGLVFCLGTLAQPIHGQEFKNSIASTDFDFITADDPSTFESLSFIERRRAELPDKRDNSLWRDAFVFEARFSDQTEVTIFIDAQFETQEAAEAEAQRYVHPLGKLPTALRRGVNRLCVHRGGPMTTAFSDIGLIVLYSENASVRISNHDLEETVFHESVHAAWDAEHAESELWRRAQALDQAFVTNYAKSKPDREDLAETALFAFTLLHHPERLPPAVQTSVKGMVPARIRYIGELLPPGEPIHFKVTAPAAQVLPDPAGESHDSESPLSLCDVRLPGIAADIISHCLLTEFSIPEDDVQKLLAGAAEKFQSGEEVFQVACQTFDIPPEPLRQSILVNLHENCRPGTKCDDAAIRAAVTRWTPKKVSGTFSAPRIETQRRGDAETRRSGV